MSDPYNSYDSNTVAIQPPKVKVAPPDRITRLKVSESWKQKFRLIEQAGGLDLPRFKELPFGERFGINFNVLGFLFGPIYYILKGLWRPVVYLVFAVMLVLLFEAMEMEKLTRGIGYVFAAIYSMRANISYYKKMVLGEAPWF